MTHQRHRFSLVVPFPAAAGCVAIPRKPTPRTALAHAAPQISGSPAILVVVNTTGKEEKPATKALQRTCRRLDFLEPGAPMLPVVEKKTWNDAVCTALLQAGHAIAEHRRSDPRYSRGKARLGSPLASGEHASRAIASERSES